MYIAYAACNPCRRNYYRVLQLWRNLAHPVLFVELVVPRPRGAWSRQCEVGIYELVFLSWIFVFLEQGVSCIYQDASELQGLTTRSRKEMAVGDVKTKANVSPSPAPGSCSRLCS